jgi:monoamine oxidase
MKKFRMGTVVKLVLEFRKQFWPGKIIGFVHAHGCSFPTLWMNKNARQIVAWAGGEQADELAGLTRSELSTLALRQLSAVFAVPQRELKASLLQTYWHDWTNDPFSRGAYSFPATGGADVAKKLNQPLRDTLYFAGEVFAPPGQEGTVHGAAFTGRIAAELMVGTGAGQM